MSERQYLVTDKHGNPWGPFDEATEAARWAHKKWPDQEQDSDHAGIGWDVIVLRGPDE